MKTIIKNKVKIGAYTVSTVEAKRIVKDGEECWGTYDTGKDRISLNKSLNSSRKQEIWIHEVLHALSIDRGIELTEKQINRLSPAIYCFLKDNKYA